MADNKFEVEIATIVQKWIDEGREIVPAFVTQEIIKSHEHGLARNNEHTEFWKHYAYKGHRKDVGSYIAKNFGDDESEEKEHQHVLPGFEHVQRHYVINRGGGPVMVPVGQMTDAEIRARVQLLRRRGAGCMAHADELERFMNLRESEAS